MAAEGEGEQSFIKWLQELSDQNGLHIYLDCQLLSGGGYEIMLDRAVRYRQQRERYNAEAAILLVDGDRAKHDDGWPLSKLREEAFKRKISVCVQNPNQEGLLLRMMSENKKLQPDAINVQKQLRKVWPNYQKPVDARTLASKYSLDDLFRVAHVGTELKNLLSIIGLLKK